MESVKTGRNKRRGLPSRIVTREDYEYTVRVGRELVKEIRMYCTDETDPSLESVAIENALRVRHNTIVELLKEYEDANH